MNTYAVTYTLDRVNFITEIVKAISYTEAYLYIIVAQPEHCIITEVKECEP